MRIPVLLALAAVTTLPATAVLAQYHPNTTTVAKRPPLKPPTPGRGSIGGPARQVRGVGGVTGRSGGINGTLRPHH
jgi:hypothetical protein